MNWQYLPLSYKISLILFISFFFLIYPIETKSDDSPTNTKIGYSDRFLVTVNSQPFNRIGQALFVVISVKNISGKDITLGNMFAVVDDVSKDYFTDTCTPKQPGEIEIRSEQLIEFSCKFSVNPTYLSFDTSRWKNWLFSTSIRFDVEVDIVGEDKGLHFYPATLVRAPESSIFVGGLAGALLLAAFLLVETMITQPSKRQEWFKSILFMLLIGARGGLMAIIALILGKSTEGGSAPISIIVSDFNGGIVVGLFSYPFASWISSTLKLGNLFEKKST